MADLAVAILCCDIPTIIPNTCPKWEIIKTDRDRKEERMENEKERKRESFELIYMFPYTYIP